MCLCTQPIRDPAVAGPLAELDVAGALVSLLRSSDGGLLHSVVVSLTRLAIDDGNRRTLCRLDPIDPLLAHLREGEHNLRMAAAELLLLLARERRTRDDIRAANGAALFLSLVSSEGARAVTLAALHLLCGLAREPEAGRDVRLLGGLPLLVGHLVRCCSTGGEQEEQQESEEAEDERGKRSGPGSHQIAEVLCTLLGKLALEDESAYQLRQANAVHSLCCLAHKCAARCRSSSSSSGGGESSGTSDSSSSGSVLRVEALCFRALRTLYACVRNRRMFDRLWPSALLVVRNQTKRGPFFPRSSFACVICENGSLPRQARGQHKEKPKQSARFRRPLLTCRSLPKAIYWRSSLGAPRGAGCRKTPFLSHFLHKNDQVAKTGS
jgi:hypothetical protein